MRSAHVNRKTKESEVDVKLNIDGTGSIDIDTGVPFFDHMLSQLGKHAGFDLTVKTKGDVDVDSHHTVEDTSLAFGQALREALGDKSGIRRFGDSMVPLDEVLVQAAVDLSGRPYLVHRQPEIVELIGTFDTTLGRHIWESIIAEARIALHIRVLEGRNAHHVFEAQFKAVARALREACARLLLWAESIGKGDELLEAMYSGYFEKKKSLFTRKDLVEIAKQVGIESDGVNALLDSDKYQDQVKADQALAAQLGANGVPFYVVNMKYGISGAQPQEAFNETLKAALAQVE